MASQVVSIQQFFGLRQSVGRSLPEIERFKEVWSRTGFGQNARDWDMVGPGLSLEVNMIEPCTLEELWRRHSCQHLTLHKCMCCHLNDYDHNGTSKLSPVPKGIEILGGKRQKHAKINSPHVTCIFIWKHCMCKCDFMHIPTSTACVKKELHIFQTRIDKTHQKWVALLCNLSQLLGHLGLSKTGL